MMELDWGEEEWNENGIEGTEWMVWNENKWNDMD